MSEKSRFQHERRFHTISTHSAVHRSVGQALGWSVRRSLHRSEREEIDEEGKTGAWRQIRRHLSPIDDRPWCRCHEPLRCPKICPFSSISTLVRENMWDGYKRRVV